MFVQVWDTSLRRCWKIRLLEGVPIGLPRQKRPAPRLQAAKIWLFWMIQPTTRSLLFLRSPRPPAKVSLATQTESTCWHQSFSRRSMWRSLLPTGWLIMANREGFHYLKSKTRRSSVHLTSWPSLHLNVSAWVGKLAVVEGFVLLFFPPLHQFLSFSVNLECMYSTVCIYTFYIGYYKIVCFG